MRMVLLVVGLVVALAVPAHAATKTVTASGFSFSPAKVSGVHGTTVRWDNGSGTHNVHSKTGMFSSGSATSTQWPFGRVFSAGSFGYYCQVHGTAMSGVVRVRPTVAAAPAGRPFTVRWATPATNTGSSFRVQYRVEGRWKTWRGSTSARGAVFGKGGAPTSVVSGRTYGFRVKSVTGVNASGFSPVRSFTP